MHLALALLTAGLIALMLTLGFQLLDQGLAVEQSTGARTACSLNPHLQCGP